MPSGTLQRESCHSGDRWCNERPLDCAANTELIWPDENTFVEETSGICDVWPQIRIDFCPLLPGRPGRRAGDEGLSMLETQLYLAYWTRISPHHPTPSPRFGSLFHTSPAIVQPGGRNIPAGGVSHRPHGKTNRKPGGRHINCGVTASPGMSSATPLPDCDVSPAGLLIQCHLSEG